MSFDAKVFKILIASPADVHEERRAIAHVIERWSALNSESMNVILLPVAWETHSAPAMGDRPQELINVQLVRGCDLLIGGQELVLRLESPSAAQSKR